MRQRGFTLIEVMISVAILAIIFSASFQGWHRTQGWLAEEMDRSRAAQMLANAADVVRALPYDQVRSGDIDATDGEARHVGADGAVPLDNLPVSRLAGVDAIGANGAVKSLDGATVDDGGVRLPTSFAGTPVRVRYVGRYCVSATCQEVDANLVPTAGAGAARLATLQVLDGDAPVPYLTVTVLRMKP